MNMEKLHALGARLIPVKPKGKKPAVKDWPNWRGSDEEIENHLKRGGNVGIVLGAPSGGLVDVDLDSWEAIALARAFLPKTGLISGRASSRSSHWWYRVSPIRSTVTLKDPDLPPADDRAMLVELRCEGGQTVVPPSVHVSGESIEWERDGDPAPVSWDDLLAAVSRLAIAALLVRAWSIGSRNQTSMAVAGWLLQAGHDPEAVEELIEAVAVAAGDEEASDRVKVVESTIKKIESNAEVVGWRRLSELIGKSRAQSLRKWLAMTGSSEAPEGGSKLAPPLSVADLLEFTKPRVRWLVHNLIEVGSKVLVVGYPKTHKTNFVLELAVSLASGTAFLHKFGTEGRRKIGLVLMEDRPGQIRRRLWRLAASRGWTLEKLDGHLFFWFRPPLRLGDVKTMNQLGELAEAHEFDVLIVDNWSLVSSGNSNDADEVTVQLAALTDLRRNRPDMTVVLIHHARKRGLESMRGERITDVIRNSSAFGAWYECGIVLELKGDAVRVLVEHRDLPPPDPFEFTVEDERPGDPKRKTLPGGWFRLRVVDPVERARAARTELEKTILAFLRKNPGCSKSGLFRSVGGKKAYALRAFEALCKVGRARSDKPGQAYKCYAVEEDDDDDEEDDDAPAF